MMRELYYTPLDLAVIISGLDLGLREQGELLDLIWKKERAFIDPEYRDDKRRFCLKVLYWLDYVYDKQTVDAQFPQVQEDAWLSQRTLPESEYLSDFSSLDTFFKSIRIKLLCGERNFVRVKLRTLLRQYGYQRRSPRLMEYFAQCLLFYHLQPYLRGEEECDLRDVDIDAMIIFRET